MRRLIFNTEGTGLSHEQLRRLENTQPGSGTYLGEAMRHLGDEIMLLEGGLDGEDDLSFIGAGNYRTRAISKDDFAVSPSAMRRKGRDFEPMGLGVVPVRYDDQPRPGTYLSGFHDAYGEDMNGLAMQYERWANTPAPGSYLNGFAARTDRLRSPERHISPDFYPLECLGDAAGDLRTAMAIAQATKSACELGCAAADMSAGDRSRCRSACQAAYDAAAAALSAAYGGGSSAPDPAAAREAELRIRELELARREAEAGRMPAPPAAKEDKTALYVGGAIALGLLGYMAFKNR